MKLSVIIPNYNNSKYLEKCLNSIINQTLQPYEIIVVDDCSTDDSADIIKRYQAEYEFVKGVFLDQNGGVSHARNVGVKVAIGDYITAIDADDFYYNDKKLEEEMNIIKTYEVKFNEDVISYSKIVLVDEKDNLIKKIDFKNNDYLIGKVFFNFMTGYKNKSIPRDMCYKKTLFIEVGGYDEERSLYEDLDLLIRLSKDNRFFCTFKFGTAYRQKDDGLSKKPVNEHNKAKKSIFVKNIKMIPIYKRLVLHLIRYSIIFKSYIKRKLKIILEAI